MDISPTSAKLFSARVPQARVGKKVGTSGRNIHDFPTEMLEIVFLATRNTSSLQILFRFLLNRRLV